VQVTFFAPAIGRAHVPLGLAGPGEAEWGPDGIRLKGPLHSKHLASLLGCLGFIVGMGLAVALIVGLGLEVRSVVGKLTLAGGVAVMFGAVLLGRKVFPAKERELLVPWDKVQKLGVDEDRVSFLSKAKPGGQVWFRGEEPIAQTLARVKAAAPAGR
jgi:hypothetical protein